VVEGRPLIEQAVAAGWECECQFVGAGGDPVDGAGKVLGCGPNVLERAVSTQAAQPNAAIVRMRERRLPLDATFVVALDQLADPGNAGTVIRSSEAAGADAVLFTPGSVDPHNPKVVRASAGSLFRVPVVTLELSSLSGLRRLATSSHRGVPYTDADLTGPLVLLLGNEAHGLSSGSDVDDWLTIPHAGPAESLNVAMAATVLVFEVARQRRAR
jgi:RNA methyltransferase, TrmH family